MVCVFLPVYLHIREQSDNLLSKWILQYSSGSRLHIPQKYVYTTSGLRTDQLDLARVHLPLEVLVLNLVAFRCFLTHGIDASRQTKARLRINILSMQGVYDSDSVCQWDKSQTYTVLKQYWGKCAGFSFTSQQNWPKSTIVLHLHSYLTGPKNSNEVCTIGYAGPGPGDRDIPIVWYIGPKYWWHQDEPSHVYLQPRLEYSSLFGRVPFFFL